MTSLLMTFINILIVALWKSRQAFTAYGWGNMPLQAVKLPISHNNVVGENTVLQLNILETCRFSTETFWRLVFSHSCFRIHLQLDFVSLEMHSEPLVWEHQSPKCFGGEPAILPKTNKSSCPALGEWQLKLLNCALMRLICSSFVDSPNDL